MNQIYEPREDSYLLQKYVEKYSYGKVLDIGTGTGIQAITASKKAKKVIATDVNKEAVKQAKLLAEIERINNIEFIQSDIFSKIPKKKFNLICFNPPYLPKDKNIEDPALFSGKRGYDVTIRFLEQVNNYLKENGIILLISSSLASQSVINDKFKERLLDVKILEKKHVFFEDIILYKLTKSELLKKLENYEIRDSYIFAHGKRGVIIKTKYKKKDAAIKIKREKSKALGNIENEKRFLRLLNKHSIGPKIIEHELLMYEFVKGIFIEEFLEKNSKKDILIVLKKIFDQMYKLDKLGINKFEMHRPLKHILIKNNNPVLIDFERARFTQKPKNVTEFCDFMIGNKVKKILDKKRIIINKKNLIDLARNYKKDISRDNYNNILNHIGLKPD